MDTRYSSTESVRPCELTWNSGINSTRRLAGASGLIRGFNTHFHLTGIPDAQCASGFSLYLSFH